MSDFGYYGYSMHNRMTDLGNGLRKHLTPDDILILGGDNFYPNGTLVPSDINKFQKYFHDIPCPIYGCLGNHDYHGQIKYQINNPYYILPHSYYTFTYKDTEVFVIDTALLSYSSESPHYYTQNYDIKVNTYEWFRKQRLMMLFWLNRKLKSSTKSKKILVGHYPMESRGMYHNQYKILQQSLFMLCIEYNIKFYFCGHDHNTQHFNWSQTEMESIQHGGLIINQPPSDYSLSQFLTGAAVRCYDDVDSHIDPVSDPECLYFNNKDIYQVIRFDTDTEIASFMNIVTGDVLYSF